jgi:SAM-dependent methyltransferase
MAAALSLLRSPQVAVGAITQTRCPLGCAPLRAGTQTLRDNRFGLPHEIRVAWCPDCGLGVTIDRPSRAELAGLYEREYPAAGRIPRHGHAARVWRAVNGSLPVLERIREGPVLDVGCHTGEMLLALRSRGLEVVGLEPNPRAAAVARSRGLHVIESPIEEAELPAGRFRSVLLSQVLEHVEEPHVIVARAHETLAPGGTAFVAVPNAGSLLARLFGPDWAHWHVPFHLYHFTERALRKLLAHTGFRPTRVDTVTPGDYVLLSLAARRNARRGSHVLEPISGRYGQRLLVAPAGRLLDAVGRGDTLWAEAVPA